MRSNVRAIGVAVAICAVSSMAGIAMAGLTFTTKVTIKAGGEVFGYVTSQDPGCSNGRKVTVYKQKGGAQGGGDDIKGPSDNASLSGDRYQWSVGNPGLTGRIYARAKAIPGCKADNSRTVPAAG